MLGYIMVTLLDHNSWIDTISRWFIISLCQECVNVHRRIPYRNPYCIHQRKPMSLWRWGFFCNQFSEGVLTIRSISNTTTGIKSGGWRIKSCEKLGWKLAPYTAGHSSRVLWNSFHLLYDFISKAYVNCESRPAKASLDSRSTGRTPSTLCGSTGWLLAKPLRPALVSWRLGRDSVGGWSTARITRIIHDDNGNGKGENSWELQNYHHSYGPWMSMVIFAS